MYLWMQSLQGSRLKHQWERKTFEELKNAPQESCLIASELEAETWPNGGEWTGSSGDTRARQVEGKHTGLLNKLTSEMDSRGCSLFSLFTLKSVPGEAADVWSVTHIHCFRGTVTFSQEWKPPADESLTFHLLPCYSLIVHRTLIPHITSEISSLKIWVYILR